MPNGDRVRAGQIAVTGLGVVGPTGVGKGALWKGLLEGRSSVSRISRFDASGYPSQIGGEVPSDCYADLIDPKRARRMPLVSKFAAAATRLALDDANVGVEWADPFRVGVVLGTSLGAYKEAAEQTVLLHERGMSRVNPFLTLSSYHHSTAGEVAIEARAQGITLTLTVGCPSGLSAIGHGADLIRQGRLDVCITGGSESPLFPIVYAGMCKAGELSTRNSEPDRASRPFDREHDGIVLSEGSAIVILEPMEHAVRRGAHVYAELLGHSSGTEAFEMYGIEPTGSCAIRTLQRALYESNCDPAEIGYISAHGNGCPRWDRKETRILRAAFGEHADRIPISSIKGAIGHSFGAAGAFQAVAAALSLETGLAPPTANFETPDPECNLSYYGGAPRAVTGPCCLISNFGYGGVNAFMVFRSVA